MGMDYKYAGSAGYQRFDTEIYGVAKIFGGKLTDDYEDRMNKAEGEKDNTYRIWGTLNVTDADRQSDNFIFPDTTPQIISDWLNHPYKMQSPSETKEIFKIVCQHPEITEISIQIWTELSWLVSHREGWEIL